MPKKTPISRLIPAIAIGFAVSFCFSLLVLGACTLPFNSDIYAAANRHSVIKSTGVTLDKSNISLVVGTTGQLTATVSPVDAADKGVNWSSDSPLLASVDATGLVTALASSGTATITATTQDGGFTATCTVTLTATTVAVTGVSLNTSALGLTLGSTSQLVATVVPGTATNSAVTWTSNFPALASVDATGLVTALASSGTATITATTQDGGFTATCTITLAPAPIPVTGVSLNASSLKLALAGDTTQLVATIAPGSATNQTVTWSSSSTAVATVNASGLVTAVNPGTTIITATTQDGGFTANCTINVLNWVAQGTGQTTGDTSYKGAIMAVDSTGTPYLSYIDSTGYAFVTKYNGSGFGMVGPSLGQNLFTINQSGGNIALAFDSANVPYVAFSDANNSGKASVMTYNGSIWVIVGTAGFSSGAATYLSLVVNGTTPYVSYMDAGPGGRTTVMTFNGTIWTSAVGTPGFSNPGSAYTALAISSTASGGNSTNNIFVAYANDATRLLTIAYNASGGATVLGGTASAGVADYVSMVADGGGALYVGFKDTASSGRASVRKYNGSSWNSVGISGFSPGQANYTSLAIGPGNTPFIAFQDVANSNYATIMKYTGTAWAVVGTAGFNGVAVQAINLAADSAGNLFLCYESSGTISVLALQ